MKEELKINQKNLELLKSITKVPLYDRSKVKTGIVHIGIGGFHRSHQAYYCEELLNGGHDLNWGICGIALLDRDIEIYNTLKQQDGLYTLIVKELDGTWNTQIIGSITEYLFAPDNPKSVIEKLADPQTKVITLTITEGGYNIDESTGEFNMNDPLIQHDLSNPQNPKTVFGYLTQALKLRRDTDSSGCTIQSCDNVQGNGGVMKKTLLTYIREAEPDLVDWVRENISFPNSMVDRITPVTESVDIEKLKEDFEIIDKWPVTCEPFIQWVIEDEYAVGRPAWEDVGAEFVQEVLPYEKMKLQLLNAGHSVLGILGALIGYTTIDESVNDSELQLFLSEFMNEEVTPILEDLGDMDLVAYKKSLIERFGNHNIKDQVSRICSETSSKLPKFLIPTIKKQLGNDGMISRSSFVIAAWAIYSLGVDENGKDLTIKDEMAKEVHEQALLAKEDTRSFLDLTAVFGNLKDSKKFVLAFVRAYDNIAKYGIKKAILTIKN